jgi:uncharacterized protein (TIGR02271 family)
MNPQDPGRTPDKTVEGSKTVGNDPDVVPLHAEELLVTKRRVITGQVKVGVVTKQTEQLVEEMLEHEHIEIERTAIGKQVDEPPSVREEGDTLIVPIVEEILVVERRLVLKEEVRVRRKRETQPYQERVVLRKQEAVITRL